MSSKLEDYRSFDASDFFFFSKITMLQKLWGCTLAQGYIIHIIVHSISSWSRYPWLWGYKGFKVTQGYIHPYNLPHLSLRGPASTRSSWDIFSPIYLFLIQNRWISIYWIDFSRIRQSNKSSRWDFSSLNYLYDLYHLIIIGLATIFERADVFTSAMNSDANKYEYVSQVKKIEAIPVTATPSINIHQCTMAKFQWGV